MNEFLIILSVVLIPINLYWTIKYHNKMNFIGFLLNIGTIALMAGQK